MPRGAAISICHDVVARGESRMSEQPRRGKWRWLRPAPMPRGAAISICHDVVARSCGILLEQFRHMDSSMAFLQPAVRLIIDATLYESFLNVIVSGVK